MLLKKCICVETPFQWICIGLDVECWLRNDFILLTFLQNVFANPIWESAKIVKRFSKDHCVYDEDHFFFSIYFFFSSYIWVQMLTVYTYVYAHLTKIQNVYIYYGAIA